MEDAPTYEGSCFCGEVGVRVTGKPVGMGYCHCDSCRRWSAAPVNAFTLWPPESVTITRGAENLASYSHTPRSERKWCRNCGGHVLTEHPQMGLTDVYAAVIPEFPFEPGIHVHYREAVVSMPDGLTKMRDVPTEMGGSGETTPE